MQGFGWEVVEGNVNVRWRRDGETVCKRDFVEFSALTARYLSAPWGTMG